MRPAWLPTRGLSVRIAAVVILSFAVTVVAPLPLAGASHAPARFPAGAIGAGPAITLSPTSGPVGTAVQVSGTGFKHKVTVDISFDSTLVATAVTSRKGGFSTASFQVLRQRYRVTIWSPRMPRRIRPGRRARPSP